MTDYRFEATLYAWDARTDTWIFADLPFDVADEIEDAQHGPRRGFGAVKVEVAIGATTWRTSIFPSKERRTFVLPVKRAVLNAESLAPGDTPTIALTPLT
ncbi:DUF1905 domain-containing protein [Demequina rhizosphaerae]|uniref:DUF1905 domain-containing protein n=1 Tax=Demequina rhizosphaerae TaxID=1638985 RepID=UPI0007845020|nr:DUF1905 domain-containing protein [Demequina rhizosphaerae]